MFRQSNSEASARFGGFINCYQLALGYFIVLAFPSAHKSLISSSAPCVIIKAVRQITHQANMSTIAYPMCGAAPPTTHSSIDDIRAILSGTCPHAVSAEVEEANKNSRSHVLAAK